MRSSTQERRNTELSGAKKRYILDGLACAQCAANIEKDLNKIEGLGDVRINFASKSVEIDPRYEEQLKRTVRQYESDVQVKTVDKAAADSSIEKGRVLSDPKFRIILVAVALFVAGLGMRYAVRHEGFLILEYILFLFAYIISGRKVLLSAFLNARHGRIFDENFLMTIATWGAIALGEYPEAAAVMIFYRVGEYLQDRAVDSSRRSIESLMELRPEYAWLVHDGGVQGAGENGIKNGTDGSEKVSPRQVLVGDLIEVRPGERVPLDGRVVRGESFMDTSAITGEPVPRKAADGDEVLSGFLNGGGLLRLRVERSYEESAVQKILSLVEHAAERRARPEKFITRFAAYYTPVILLTAIAIAVLPPLFSGAAFSTWIYRALILLVISCPCALVVSIPLSYFAGVGKAAREGILVKGAEYLDRLHHVKTVALDKTGTLTKGIFTVRKVSPADGFSEDELLRFAATAERNSNHPIAASIREVALHRGLESVEVTDYHEAGGRGVVCHSGALQIAAGNEKLMQELGVNYDESMGINTGTIVYVAVDCAYAGYIQIDDEIRPEALAALKQLKRLGTENLVMLTGDGHHAASKIAEDLGIRRFYSELHPEEKVDLVNQLENEPHQSPVLFIGDGMNDAPVLTTAHIGVSMGGIGSDAALEAADVVLMRDDLNALPAAMRIAAYTRRIVFQNIGIALGVKVVAAILGVAGLATMWAAVFADVGVTLIAVANALRVLKFRDLSGSNLI